MQEVPKVPLPFPGSSPGASPMPGHGASGQLKEEDDGAHQKYSAVIIFIALPVAKDAEGGGGIQEKGLLPTAQRKALTQVSRISWEEQGVMKVG